MPLNWKIYSVRDLSGGVNRSVSGLLQPNDEVRLAVNWNLRQKGALQKDSGYSQRGTSIANASDTLGLASYYYSGARKQIAVIDLAASSDAYAYNPGNDTWTAQSLALSAGAKAEFATFLDGLFMVNFEDNSYYYNGTTWSTSTNLSNAPKAKYIIVYMDRLYMAYLDVSATTHSSRVAYSSLPDDSYAITWDMGAEGQHFDVSPKDGDVITALGMNFSRLLIFKENALFRYDTNTLYQLPGAPGTNSQRSVVNVLGRTIYFHKNGIYGISEEGVALLSGAIQEVIEGVKSINLDRVCAYRDRDEYVCFLGDVSNPDTGLEINNCIVRLDTAKMKWTVGSLAHEPRVFNLFRDDRSSVEYDDTSYEYDYSEISYDGLLSAQDFVCFGDSSGDIFMLSESANTHDGTSISAYFESPNYYFAGKHRKGVLQAARFYLDAGRRIRLFYSLDDGPWRSVQQVKRETDQLLYTFDNMPVANRIKIKGIDDSVGEKSTVLGYDFFYSPLDELT